MLYSLDQTNLFASLQTPPATLVDIMDVLKDEHCKCSFDVFPEINGKKGVRPEKYAEIKNPTPSAVDLVFAVSKGSSSKMIISEMKFGCYSIKKVEELASDIVGKVKGTRDLFTQDIPFCPNVYVLVDDAQQQVLSRLQKELSGKKDAKYRVCLLRHLYDDFFVEKNV